MPLVILLATVFLGAGTTLAAQSSLPGDLLYSVKIHVNEEIRAAAALSSEAKAQVAADRAARRLAEAEALAAEGKLEGDAKTQVEANFKAFADRAAERIEALQAKSDKGAAIEASSHFEAALRAHEAILDRFRMRDDGERDPLHAVLGGVRVRAEAVSRLREKSEAELKKDDRPEPAAGSQSSDALSIRMRSKQAAQAQLARSIKHLEDAKTLVAESDARLSAESKAKAQADLAAAASSLAEGQAKLQASLYGEAFVRFRAAARKAEQVRAFVKGLLDLSVELDDDAAVQLRVKEKSGTPRDDDETQPPADAPQEPAREPREDKSREPREDRPKPPRGERPEHSGKPSPSAEVEGEAQASASGPGDSEVRGLIRGQLELR